MKYRFLGRSGLRVSEVALGTMTFGGTGIYEDVGHVSQAEANAIVGTAIDAGISLIDTADVYSDGLAEKMLGEAIGGRRRDVVLATKARFRLGTEPNDVGLSRHHILEACENSLRRLRTDYIDIYQIHSFDPFAPFEETLRALDDLVRQGKVRYVGCSNLAAWQMMKALAISEQRGFERFVSLQAYYSIGARDVEYEIVPACLDQGVGLLCWSPLAGGFFSGKFRRGKPRPNDGRRADPHAQANAFCPVDESKGLEIIEVLSSIAKRHGASIAQTALNYLLRKPAVCSVIVGATRAEHVTEAVRTVQWELLPEEMTHLDDMSRPPKLYPHWHHELTRLDR
jgi:aryl-alcohol dehydrogenase-like predicted oxidoreductase